MKNFLLAVLVTTGSVFAATRADAQYGNPYGSPLQRPTVTPYLGLIRPGGTIGDNYILGVRPEMQLRNQLNQQQEQTNRLANQNYQLQQMLINPYTQPGADVITGASRTMRPTGHSTGLLSLGGHFMSRSAGMGSGSSSRGGSQPALNLGNNSRASYPAASIPTASNLANQYRGGY